MRHLLYIILLSIALSFEACGYDSFGDLAMAGGDQPMVNSEISLLAEQYAITKERRVVYDDIIIGGFVTANDKDGNFFRSFTIQDHTAAMEIKAGGYTLHNHFPVGRHITVKAKGLSVGGYDGVVQIGIEPTNYGDRTLSPDYITTRVELLDARGYIYNSKLIEEVRPLAVSKITDLEQVGCGILIKIEQLRFGPYMESDSLQTWAIKRKGVGTKPEIGRRVFSDGYGGEIVVVTSGYSSFASDTIPDSRVTLTGLFSKSKSGTFQLKIRDRDDIQIH